MTSLGKKLISIFICALLLMFTLNPVHGQTGHARNSAEKVFDEVLLLRQKGTQDATLLAKEKLIKANEVFRQSGDKENELLSLLLLGRVHGDMNEIQISLQFDNQALNLSREIKSRQGEAISLSNIATTYFTLNEKRKSIDYYEQSLPLFQLLGDKINEALVVGQIANISNQIGEKQKALEFYNKAIPLYQLLKDERGLADTFGTLGSLYQTNGDGKLALESFEKALAIYKSLNITQGEASCLVGIGMYYVSGAQYQKALLYLNEAMSKVRTLGDKQGQATTLLLISTIYTNTNDYQKALAILNEALGLMRETGLKDGEIVVGNQIALTYSSLGEQQKALSFLQDNLEYYKKIENREMVAITLNNIGKVYGDLNENERALEFYVKANEAIRGIGNKKMEATILSNLGWANVKDLQKSLGYFNQALTYAREVKDKSKEALILSNIGNAYLEAKEYDKALDHLLQSVEVAQTIDDFYVQAVSLGSIGKIYTDKKSDRLAIAYGKNAFNIFQKLREKVTGLDKETQKSFLKTAEGGYRELVALFIANNRLTEALQSLNLFKDQQYFDSNPNKSRNTITLTGREDAFITNLNEKLQTIRIHSRQINELESYIGNRSPNAVESQQLQQSKTDLQNARVNYHKFVKDAEKEFSSIPNEQDKIPVIEDLPKLQTTLQSVSIETKQKTVAIYTLVAEENYHSLIITPNGIFKVSSPVKGEIVNQKAQKLWSILQTPEYDPQPLAKELYDIVFSPLAVKLPIGTKTIMWSLDGNLRYLPVPALYDGRQYLVERYNSVLFTRVNNERLKQNVASTLLGLGLGTSDEHTVKFGTENFKASALPFVETELSQIFKTEDNSKGVLSGEVLINTQFTKERMLSELKKRRPVVHIASHFKFEPGDETRSFLLLGDGTPFTLDEMKREANLFEGVELLVLSACQTAAQRPDASGREIDGFAELAQRLGAGAVIASLWEVSDDSTSALMANFYRSYNSKIRINKAESLRAAQLALLKGTYKPVNSASRELIREKEANDSVDKVGLKPFKINKLAPYAHPFYWSPFTLVGNWK